MQSPAGTGGIEAVFCSSYLACASSMYILPLLNADGREDDPRFGEPWMGDMCQLYEWCPFGTVTSVQAAHILEESMCSVRVRSRRGRTHGRQLTVVGRFSNLMSGYVQAKSYIPWNGHDGGRASPEHQAAHRMIQRAQWIARNPGVRPDMLVPEHDSWALDCNMPVHRADSSDAPDWIHGFGDDVNQGPEWQTTYVPRS